MSQHNLRVDAVQYVHLMCSVSLMLNGSLSNRFVFASVKYSRILLAGWT